VKGFASARRFAPETANFFVAGEDERERSGEVRQIDGLNCREGGGDESFGVASTATEKLRVAFSERERFFPIRIVWDGVGVAYEREFDLECAGRLPTRREGRRFGSIRRHRHEINLFDSVFIDVRKPLSCETQLLATLFEIRNDFRVRARRNGIDRYKVSQCLLDGHYLECAGFDGALDSSLHRKI
jgi:hypothetical protein